PSLREWFGRQSRDWRDELGGRGDMNTMRGGRDPRAVLDVLIWISKGPGADIYGINLV
ncbi:4442_t:CDS:1, partial [Acaulospora colombiana]